MSVLKVGLMGCGRIAQSVHLPVLTQMPNVELVALAEVDPDCLKKANLLAPKAVPYSDYKKLLEMGEVEAVIICLPNDLHAEAAVASLEWGKHLYLEKPLAMTLEEGRKVLQTWQKAGTVGMIGFNFRFHPLYKAARQAIQLGRIGDLVSVRSVFSTATQYSAICERSRQVGGLLLDLASHHVDLIHFFLGQEIQNVWAAVKPPGDAATLELQFTTGLLAQSFFSWNAIEEDRFEFYGRRGKLAVDRYLSLDLEFTDPIRSFDRPKRLWQWIRSLGKIPYALDKVFSPIHEPSFQSALQNFVSAVKTNRSASPDLKDGYRSLAIIKAAEESARTGLRVYVVGLNSESFAR
jgi:myo-inositol 2-dehydrogenase/D-chiro-inositol 1-dehydrogenase